MPSRNKNYGWKRSPRRVRGLGHLDFTLGGVVPLRESSEVEMPAAIDQGPLGSCTANAWGVAVQAQMPKVAGEWQELLSRLMLYYGERAIEGSISDDSGAVLSDGARFLTEVGICRESKWPYDVSRFKERPSFEAFVEAHRHQGIAGAHRLDEDDPHLVYNIAAAIDAGFPVVWGTELDQAFEDLKPGEVWPGVTEQVVGGHAMVLTAQRDYGKEFKSQSSWTPDFCENGSAWVSAGAVSSRAAGDYWVVTPQTGWLP